MGQKMHFVVRGRRKRDTIIFIPMSLQCERGVRTFKVYSSQRERERLADIKDPQHQKDHPRWREAPTREWIQDETLSITSANFCLLWEFHTV